MKRIIFLLPLLVCFQTSYGQQTGTFTDPRDGKVYKTIKIGDQTWLAENFAYKTKSGCWAYNDDTNNVATYGYLYDWKTAKSIYPIGWHLPSEDEWESLFRYLHDNDSISLKMKSTTGWGADNNGNNVSGFSGLPGGIRDFFSGNYSKIGENGFWWSSTEFKKNPLGAYNFSLFKEYVHYPGKRGENGATNKSFGLSVRYIKNIYTKPTNE